MLSLSSLIGVLFLSCKISAVPTRRSVNCEQFSGSPGTGPPMTCDRVPDYPTTIYGATFDLYHWTDNWAPTSINLNTLGLMPTVAGEVLKDFSQWCQLSSITMMLLDRLPDDQAAEAVTEQSDRGSKCYVRLKNPAPGTETLQTIQTIAHELYHCIQNCQNYASIVDAPFATWWVEGTAEYMANYYYPAITADGSSPVIVYIEDYDIRTPIYRQDPEKNGEQAALFFMSLSKSGWKNEAISAWTKGHSLATSEGTERASLSQDSQISAEFVKFAQRFVDRDIQYSNGQSVLLKNAVPQETEQITKASAPTLLWSIEPFTAKMWVIGFPEKGDTIQVSIDTEDTTAVLNYRKTGTKEWLVLSELSPLTVNIPCDGVGGSFDFLLTSTDNSDSSVGSIAFKVENTPCSECEDTGIPIDPCLFGNWVVDDASMQAVILAAEQAALGPGVSVSVTGTSTFNVVAPNANTVTFDALEVGVIVPFAGTLFTTKTTATGTVTAQIVAQGSNAFCWTGLTATGTSTTDIGLGGDPLVLPLESGYSKVIINYVCDATKLVLSGTSANGKIAWQYVYGKTSAP